jgi:hypothetical protein
MSDEEAGGIKIIKEKRFQISPNLFAIASKRPFRMVIPRSFQTRVGLYRVGARFRLARST